MQERPRILPIVGIFLIVSMAWLTLSGTMLARSNSQQGVLTSRVGDLWGSSQSQPAPVFTLHWTTQVEKKEVVYDSEKQISETKTKWITEHHARHLDPASARITTNLALDERRKGLVWFPLYTVDFEGDYTLDPIDLSLIPENGDNVEIEIGVRLPSGDGTYDSFEFFLDDDDISGKTERKNGLLLYRYGVKEGVDTHFRFAYRSRGLDTWLYLPLPLMNEAGLIEDFELVLNTDFHKIDFPGGSMSPSSKARTEDGWTLTWAFDRILTGQSIGMVMPQRVQPGELGAKLSASAPISLGFFTVVLFVIGFMKKYRIHPIHYAFISAAFFAFHLLFAYIADHLPVEWAFSIASGTSVFLIVSYMRLVISNSFAFGPVAIAQLIYVVGFSVAHFFDGFTGLSITVLGILTLFWLMQITGRIDWYASDQAKAEQASPSPASG